MKKDDLKTSLLFVAYFSGSKNLLVYTSSYAHNSHQLVLNCSLGMFATSISSLHTISHALEEEILTLLAFPKAMVEPIEALANSWAALKYLFAYLETNHSSCLLLSVLHQGLSCLLVIRQENSYCDFRPCQIE